MEMAVTQINIEVFVRLAGMAQLGLVIGSLAVPKFLNWRLELVKVQPLIKQMFWVYAAYIVVINLCFGLVSVFCYRELGNGSVLAALINGFIAVYWLSRVGVQFFYFDRKAFPQGRWFLAGETALVVVFVSLSIIYSLGFYHNILQS